MQLGPCVISSQPAQLTDGLRVSRAPKARDAIAQANGLGYKGAERRKR
jgi:hypothetical protein